MIIGVHEKRQQDCVLSLGYAEGFLGFGSRFVDRRAALQFDM